jgi:multiple sugar transport system ATP-binding protein
VASVEIQHVVKSYDGKQTVVHGVDLSVGHGEFVVLVGPSGCGKSTLLRMIAGLESISGGDILIDGQRVNDLPPRDRGIAMVFQSYALYPHMSVADNMGFGLKMAGVAAERIAASVKQAATILQIEHMLERKPKDLSGGQRQRVAIGRAIVRSPKLFLLRRAAVQPRCGSCAWTCASSWRNCCISSSAQPSSMSPTIRSRP